MAGVLNKRLMLSSSFRCDQIYKYEISNLGHTLLCYLSPTLMFNELTWGERKLTIKFFLINLATDFYWQPSYLQGESSSLFFLVKRVPGWGPEQRESEKTVLYPQVIIILISYIVIKLLIIENHPSRNWKQNCSSLFSFLDQISDCWTDWDFATEWPSPSKSGKGNEQLETNQGWKKYRAATGL